MSPRSSSTVITFLVGAFAVAFATALAIGRSTSFWCDTSSALRHRAWNRPGGGRCMAARPKRQGVVTYTHAIVPYRGARAQGAQEARGGFLHTAGEAEAGSTTQSGLTRWRRSPAFCPRRTAYR